MNLQPYVFFDGRCDEALAFYASALGAKVEFLMRFSESPDLSSVREEQRDKVMHCNVRIGETQFMMSDGQCLGGPRFEGFALTINADSSDEADRMFAALSEGGQVQMPMTETFFAHRFGMVGDKFGVSWMLLVAKN